VDLPRVRALARTTVVGVAALGAATALAALLQNGLGVPNPSAVYILAVALVALAGGRVAVLVAAVASFLLYDLLFVHPRFAFTVADPGEWLNLVLLLAVGLLVGQMAALLRIREETAVAREREARTLFSVSRELATRPSTLDVLPRIVEILCREATLDRAWIALDEGGARRRPVADTGAGAPIPEPGGHRVLRRRPGDEPAEWVAVHTGKRSPDRRGPLGRRGPPTEAFRVAIEAGGRSLGAVWALRPRADGPPGPTETRLVAAVADQVGQALEQDRLAAAARDAEIARESDALKSALLESVSHDLRTPLASIRAAAGSLIDDQVELGPEDRRATAEMIDREADHLNRIVTNLLDLSRVEAGALRVERDVYDLADLLEPTVDRARGRLASHDLDVELGNVPPVDVDAVLLDQVVANLLENAAKYTPPGTLVRIAAHTLPDDAWVRLTVEDAGPGAPDASLPHLFEKFYRVPGRSAGSRSGTGVGLAVVRGLTGALGGRTEARRSDLGGLAIDVDLPAARPPAAEEPTP
jgi:two-component system sensor histidine kinase KdpD